MAYIHYNENVLTYEVSPYRFVCTDAVVDEGNQPLKQPVRGQWTIMTSRRRTHTTWNTDYS